MNSSDRSSLPRRGKSPESPESSGLSRRGNGGRNPLARPVETRRTAKAPGKVYRVGQQGTASVVSTAPSPVASAAGSGNDDGRVRLNKRMADLGMCSRREADGWIEKGWVRVNGKVAEMGSRVVLADEISVDRQAQGQQSKLVTILLNKPVGYVSGQAEDGHQPAVTLIRAENHWQGDSSRVRFHPGQLRGLAPAGRLDIDSVGLLVLTQDGRVARRLIGEDSTLDKEYLVRVHYAEVEQDIQAVFPQALLERLRHGLSLDGKLLKPAQVDWQNSEQLRFILHEGKKRQIRRMCEQVGLKVVGLKRIRMGRVLLGQLPPGKWRYLSECECF